MHSSLRDVNRTTQFLRDQFILKGEIQRTILIENESSQFLDNVQKEILKFISELLSYEDSRKGLTMIPSVDNNACSSKNEHRTDVENHFLKINDLKEKGGKLTVYIILNIVHAVENFIDCYLKAIANALEEPIIILQLQA